MLLCAGHHTATLEYSLLEVTTCASVSLSRTGVIMPEAHQQLLHEIILLAGELADCSFSCCQSCFGLTQGFRPACTAFAMTCHQRRLENSKWGLLLRACRPTAVPLP